MAPITIIIIKAAALAVDAAIIKVVMAIIVTTAHIVAIIVISVKVIKVNTVVIVTAINLVTIVAISTMTPQTRNEQPWRNRMQVKMFKNILVKYSK